MIYMQNPKQQYHMTKMNGTKNNKVILRLHMEQNALFYKRF